MSESRGTLGAVTHILRRARVTTILGLGAPRFRGRMGLCSFELQRPSAVREHGGLGK
jgi:hypothetical protein